MKLSITNFKLNWINYLIFLHSDYNDIQVTIKGRTGIIILNRPKTLNALCDSLMSELLNAAHIFDKDDNIGAIIITGNSKSFAAGADIKEMSSRTYVQSYLSNQFKSWNDLTHVVKPTIAAVSGYALGKLFPTINIFKIIYYFYVECE